MGWIDGKLKNGKYKYEAKLMSVYGGLHDSMVIKLIIWEGRWKGQNAENVVYSYDRGVNKTSKIGVELAKMVTRKFKN